MADLPRLRYVIIGVGANVVNLHRPALQNAQQQGMIEIVAASDISAERGRPAAHDLNCAFYADHLTMLEETQPDVALITTTHPFHAALALDCINRHCHVLVEKPLAVHIQEADTMISAAARAGVQMGVCFQWRYEPSVMAAAALIRSGSLGEVQHVAMSVLWTRPRLYFRERTWRGTWQHEGGGVLLNQAAHNLDMLCYLVGLPERVYAWVRTQKHHIETEDTAQAQLQWANGAMGSFHVSTAEAGPPNRLEIWGTKGYLIFTDYTLRHYALAQDFSDYLESSTDPYAPLPSTEQAVSLPASPGLHIAMHQDFQQAVRSSQPPRNAAQSASMSLELANAMMYSAHTGKVISLPLDREAYAHFINQKRHPAPTA